MTAYGRSFFCAFFKKVLTFACYEYILISENAKTTEEALMIMQGQALQLQSIINAYMGQEVQR